MISNQARLRITKSKMSSSLKTHNPPACYKNGKSKNMWGDMMKLQSKAKVLRDLRPKQLMEEEPLWIKETRLLLRKMRTRGLEMCLKNKHLLPAQKKKWIETHLHLPTIAFKLISCNMSKNRFLSKSPEKEVSVEDKRDWAHNRWAIVKINKSNTLHFVSLAKIPSEILWNNPVNLVKI